MSKHTPGPWRWELNEKSKRVQLCGAAGFDLTVMDFVRWGMGGASPRLRDLNRPDLNLMKRIDIWGSPVEGRLHHESWFKAINHPDANLIAVAPDLLAACWLISALCEKDGEPVDGFRFREAVQMARAAIAKAESDAPFVKE